MNAHTIRLIDSSQTTIATAQVADEGDYYGGTVDLTGAPSKIRSLFAEFEEAVNNQTFSHADIIEDNIAALGIRAVLENGEEVGVSDLQVFPTTGNVSFRTTKPVSSERTASPPPVAQETMAPFGNPGVV